MRDSSINPQVQLLDLSKDAFKFEDLDKCFPTFVPLVQEKLNVASALRGRHALEVHQVGAYQMSVAPTLADLNRIDASVFTVPANITELMATHYGKGFAFVICVFDPTKEIKPHPIGYVHDWLAPSKMFVPCRHEHGHGTPEKERFDHRIYSLNTGSEGGAGESPEDTRKNLEHRAAKEGGTIVQPASSAAVLLAKSAVLAPLLSAASAAAAPAAAAAGGGGGGGDTPALGPLLIRRRLIVGLFNNADLTFTVAA
jgi:hypothetical protein